MPRIFQSVRSACNEILSTADAGRRSRRVAGAMAIETRDTIPKSLNAEICLADKKEDALVEYEDDPDALARLKEDDPFAFYSISSNKRRSFGFGGDENLSASTSALFHSSPSRLSSGGGSFRRASLPISHDTTNIHAEYQAPRRASVVRCRRMSTEAHPSLIFLEEAEALGEDASILFQQLDDADVDLLKEIASEMGKEERQMPE